VLEFPPAEGLLRIGVLGRPRPVRKEILPHPHFECGKRFALIKIVSEQIFSSFPKFQVSLRKDSFTKAGNDHFEGILK